MGLNQHPLRLTTTLPRKRLFLSRSGIQQYISESLERTNSGDGRMGHLDGLRAIAVIGVLLFHFRVPGAGGAFLGVDIFYILSGFLMTRSILIQNERSSFRMAKFLLARALRICPALLTTILITLALSVHVFPMTHVTKVADSGMAAALFRSNMHFLAESGYHDASSTEKPLLHTWSLSVEGQFYFLWSLVALLESADLILITMTALVGGSIFFQLAAAGEPSALFFTLPSRLYQFGAGALALLLYDRPGLRTSSLCHMLSAVSIVLSFALVKTHHNPIALSSFPTVASSVLFISTPNGPLSKVLSSRIPRCIGKLSYTIYLIHWPCIVLAAYAQTQMPMLVAAILTATLTPILFYCVEEAFRTSKLKGQRIKGYIYCAILLAGIIGYTNFLHVESDKVMRRAEVAASASIPSPILTSAETQNDDVNTSNRSNKGFPNASTDSIASRALARIIGGGPLEQKRVKEIEMDLRSRKTMPGQLDIPGRAPNYTLIIGDSYATSLIVPMQLAVAAKPDMKIVQAVVHVCMPALDPHGMSAPRIHQAPNYHERCMNSYHRYSTWLASNPPSRIILIARWRDYLEYPNARERLDASIQGFAKHTGRLTVLGVVPIPPMVSRPPKNIMRCLEENVDANMKGLKPGTAERCPREFRDVLSRKLERVLAQMVAKVGNVGEFVSVLDGPLCRKGSDDDTGVPLCSAWTPEDGAYFGDDFGHLTLAGAETAWGMLNIGQ